MGIGICLTAGVAGSGGAAIALQPLTITLQTGPRNPYHAVSRPVLLAQAVTMESPRVGHTPIADERPADPAGPRGLDSTFDLVERAK
jgi:hypothetical protein